jgi:hypothetical protein
MQGTPGSTFGAWEITSPAPAFHGSYGYNMYLFSGFSERPNMGPGRDAFPDLDIFSLQGRAAIPVLLDSVFLWSAPRAFEPPPRREFPGGGGDLGAFCINRHSEAGLAPIDDPAPGSGAGPGRPARLNHGVVNAAQSGLDGSADAKSCVSTGCRCHPRLKESARCSLRRT